MTFNTVSTLFGNLLGAVIEGASGQSYGDYMRENVWKPLGMNDIRRDSPTDIIPNRMRGYELAGGQVKNSEFVDVSSRFAAGGTRATVTDLLKFGKGIAEGKILSKTSLELFELLTGETWNTNAYINSERNKRPLYFAMVGAFEEGRASFEKTGKPFTDNTTELAQAFNYFNQNLNDQTLQAAQQQDILRKVREGRQISAGQPFAKIGSYMAEKLRQKFGAAQLAAYSNTGAIAFFNDYIELYGKDASVPKEFRFNEAVEKSVAAWQTGWSKTNTAEMRQIVINPDSNFDEIGARLRKDFAGATVYPNLSGSFTNAIQQLTIQGQLSKALKVGELAVELYPALDPSNAYYGVVLVLSGEKEKGKQFLKRAAEINGNSVASAAGLNGLAYNLAGIGMADAGLTILQAAAELYPQEANLYDSIGEFYAKKGVKDKAIEFYQKALATNPKYPNAEKAKEIVQQLSVKP